MITIKSYNTKIIDFGNGDKQVVCYSHSISIEDDEDIKYLKSEDRKSKIKANSSTALSDSDIEKKYLHSLFTSCNRSKNELYKLARSNDWDYFLTLTFSREKVKDRTDYDYLRKITMIFFNNLKRVQPDLKFLGVPEQHKKIERNNKRAWHFHFLIANCDKLTFEKLTNIAYYNKVNEDVYLLANWRYGYSTATKVKDNDRVTRYLSKYITKSLTAVTKGKSRYIASRNLNKAKEYKYMCHSDFFVNDNLTDTVSLDTLIDKSKIVYEKEKLIATDEFCNTYKYIELRNDTTPIIKNGKVDI